MRMDPDEPGSGSIYYQTPRHAIQFGRSRASLKIFGADGIKNWDAEDDESLANVLKKLHPEYVCAHFGKWHIGRAPGELGYDVHDGPNGNGAGNSKDTEDTKKIPELSHKGNEFMEKQVKAGNPFFLQISHYADHLRHQALQTTIDKYEKEHADKATQYQNNPVWAAMNENLDTGVGMVLDKIDELGIRDNTYVIYTADNGYEDKKGFGKPVHERGYYKAYPQRSHKYHVSEGGIRVPFIVRGPGIQAGTHSPVLVVGTDVLMTVMDIVGSVDQVPERVEGASLLEHLKSGAREPVRRRDPFLVFKYTKPRIPHDMAIVQGDYKLIKDIDTGRIFLFNLKKDIGESCNLADQESELAKWLHDTIIRYFKRFGWDESQAGTIASDLSETEEKK